jgi:flavin-binding protein dodecin
VTHPELAPEAIAAMFRAALPPVIGRIADDALPARRESDGRCVGVRGIVSRYTVVSWRGRHDAGLAIRALPPRDDRRRGEQMPGGNPMPDKTYKIVDVVGVSEENIHQAVRNALKKASQTLRNLEWFEVQNIRGAVNSKGEPEFQVTLKIGFRLEGGPV